MLSLFPELLSYGLLAPFFLRITVGLALSYTGYHIITSQKAEVAAFYSKRNVPASSHLPFALGGATLLTALFLLIGLYTQGAALAAIVILIILAPIKSETGSPFLFSPSFYWTLTMISFSLLLLGAGAFAFDLPL